MSQQTAGQPGAGEAVAVCRSRTFPGTPEQAGEARRFLAALLGGCPLADDAVACLGELVSNAVLHSASRRPGGTFTVRAALSPGRLRVDVVDDGGPWAPRPAAGPGTAGGRGLAIVAALADEWGIAPTTAATARTAWFTLRRPGHLPGGMPAGAAAHPGLPCPDGERVQAVRDWLRRLERRQVRGVTLAKISRDLWPVLGSPAGSPDPHAAGPGNQQRR